MSGEKGYVQFRSTWKQTPAPDGPAVDALRAWRDRLYRLGMVGVYPDGIGYGNLSSRVSNGGTFIISGTNTGRLASLGPEHFTEVTGYDVEGNALSCCGPVPASSESLSHAAVYRTASEVRAVIHVHHLGLWQGLYGKVPTTDPAALAGTPEMALAIEALFHEGPVCTDRLIVMGGHREGLIAFGETLDEAATRILEAYTRFAR